MLIIIILIKFVKKHKKSYSIFCDYCKENLRTGCTINHKNHSIKNLIGIIPNNEEKTLIPMKARLFEEKINKLYNIIKKRKELFKERYENLKNYFEFILYINDKFYKGYNDSIIDYYNFEILIILKVY